MGKVKNKIKKDKEVSTAQCARGTLSRENTLDDTLRVKQKWEKVIFISAFALADFSVANILMALPLATTELPTCNYSLVIKTKNGVCQNRATPFWAADNSPRLSICSAPLRSGKATFLLPLVPVVSLRLLLFPARPSPVPGAPVLFQAVPTAMSQLPSEQM